MKKILKISHFFLYILLIYYFCDSSYSQNIGSAYLLDCGTWVIDTVYYERWVNVDTINYNPNADTTWTYTEWQYAMPEYTYLVFCPCGCGYDDWEIRKRVSDIGIIQRQKRVTRYKYIESDFQKRVNQLKN